jgi:hypothetical protein
MSACLGDQRKERVEIEGFMDGGEDDSPDELLFRGTERITSRGHEQDAYTALYIGRHVHQPMERPHTIEASHHVVEQHDARQRLPVQYLQSLDAVARLTNLIMRVFKE